MPVRSHKDRVLRWPDAQAVHVAARAWAEGTGTGRPDVQTIGYFGSYARGNWGVGSDLDVVIIMDDDSPSAEQRSLSFELPRLPVPVDLLVYTATEWDVLRSGRMKRPAGEMVWLYHRQASDLRR